MGWTSSWQWPSKTDVVNYVNSRDTIGNDHDVIKSTVRGNRLWRLIAHKKKDVIIDLFVDVVLIQKFSKGEWGYKIISDSCGPAYYDCPLGYIESSEKILGQTSRWLVGWRQKVRHYHAKKRETKKITSTLSKGQVLEYGSKRYRLIDLAGKRRGWNVCCLDDGRQYRMKAYQINSASVVQ